MIQMIRADSADVLARCLRIRELVFTLEKGVPKEIEVDGNDRLDGVCGHFLVILDGRDVGAARLMPAAENAVRIQRFCILKEFRGLGLGRRMIGLLENICRREGAVTMEMDAKLEAAPFYEKCGYERVSGVFTEAGVEHVKMKKEITGRI